MFRLALAAFMGLSACADDGAKDPLSDPGNVGGSTELRQSADLSGAYANRVRILGDSWKATAAGSEVSLVFELSGIDAARLRQFEVTVVPEPVGAFDLSTATFTAADPPFLVPPFLPQGVQLEDDGSLRMAWAILGEPQRPLASTETVGTFTIRTSGSFNTFTRARLRVILLSFGPSSSERDRYDAQALRLGVEVN